MYTQSGPVRRKPPFAAAGPLIAGILASLLFGTAAAEEVLSVADLIANREALDGKVVTVRGIYSGEAVYGSMFPDFRTQRLDEASHQIRVELNDTRYYRLFGRLERSLIEVRGAVWYNKICDERMPYEQRVSGPDSILICHVLSGVGLESVSRLKIIDSYAADDPRIPDDRIVHRTVESLLQSDPKHAEFSDLARAWRRAIFERNFEVLKVMSANEFDPSDPANRMYNLIFRGADSLRNQMLRNSTNPFFVVSRRWPDEVVRTTDQERYEDLEICYCLREKCSARDMKSLGRIRFSSLKDPLWCFDVEPKKGNAWRLYLNNY